MGLDSQGSDDMGFESQASALPYLFLDLYTLGGVYFCKNTEKNLFFEDFAKRWTEAKSL